METYIVLSNAIIYIVVSIIGMVYSKDKDKFNNWVLVFLCGISIGPALIVSGLIVIAICIYILMEGIPWIISKILNKKFNK